MSTFVYYHLFYFHFSVSSREDSKNKHIIMLYPRSESLGIVFESVEMHTTWLGIMLATLKRAAVILPEKVVYGTLQIDINLFIWSIGFPVCVYTQKYRS